MCYRGIVFIIVVVSLRAAGGEPQRLEGLGGWWYSELPSVTPETEPSIKIAREWIHSRRKSLLLTLSKIPADLRPAASYIFRLQTFCRGGPPIGTPLAEYSNYYGSWLSGADLTFSIVKKVRRDKLITQDVLRSFMINNYGLRHIAVRVMSAMDILTEDDKSKINLQIKKDAEKETIDYVSLEQPAVDAAIRDGINDRHRFEYGKSSGPVGDGASKKAIQDLMSFSEVNLSDDRWETCIDVIRKERDSSGIAALFKFIIARQNEEPSDEVWDSSAINKYPAVSALLEFDTDVPKFVEQRIAELPVGGKLASNDAHIQRMVEILAAILTPPKCIQWLDSLDSKFVNNPRTEQCLFQVRVLKNALLRTKFIPQFVTPRPFFGPVELKDK